MVRANLASTNAHKVEEIEALVSKDLLELAIPEKKLEVVEDGADFHENALIKAKAYYDQFNKVALADDSGLVVDALPDELGIHSARFGGADLDTEGKNALLLNKLDKVTNRSAYYVCVLCLYLSPDEIYYFEGRLHGDIAQSSVGSGGFGYDPLFIPTGQSESLANLEDWKALNSHRAKACKQMEKYLQGQQKQLDK